MLCSGAESRARSFRGNPIRKQRPAVSDFLIGISEKPARSVLEKMSENGFVTEQERQSRYRWKNRTHFQPVAGGRPSGGRTDDQGYNELLYVEGTPGALSGTHNVLISTRCEPDSDSSDPVRQTRRPEMLPPQFNTNTSLEVILDPGKDEVRDFRLSSSDDPSMS